MSHSPPRVKAVGGVTTLTITDRFLDGENLQAVLRHLRRLAKQPGRCKLRLDLGAVKALSGGGLGQLVTLHKDLRAAGGRLTVCNVDRMVYEVFQVTRLTKLLDVRPKG